MTNFEKVGLFMKTFGQEVKDKAEFPNEKLAVCPEELIPEPRPERRTGATDQLPRRPKRPNNLLTLCPSRFNGSGCYLALSEAKFQA